MSETKGYFKDDLKVYYNKMIIPEDHKYYPPYKTRSYRFFTLMKGEAVIKYDNEEINLTAGQMIFVDLGTFFCYNFNAGDDIYYLEFDIFTSVLNENTDDMFFLRGLQDMPIENRVINLFSPKFSDIKHNIVAIINCINKDLGRAHILPRIKSIISDLDVYYDELNPTYNKTSDSIYVNILNYIRHHYTENITYELISKKFFISKPTVIKLFKLNQSQTMHEYIEELRLLAAKTYLTHGITANKAANYVGYKDYSAFLTAYKKHFGLLPSSHKRKPYKKHPLS